MAHGDLQAVVNGVQSARQMFDLSAGQWLEDSDQLARAEDAIRAEVMAILNGLSSAALQGERRVLSERVRAAALGGGTETALFEALPRHTAQGLVDSPLAPWSEDPLSESLK